MFEISSLPWRSKAPPVTIEGNEKMIDAFSTHWIKYVVPSILYVLIGAAAFGLLLLARSMTESALLVAHGSFLAGVILLTLVHHWFFHRILSEGMVDVIITNKRLIFLEDKLWVSDNMHVVTLANILGVEARKEGIISNIFRFGSLWFDTGGSDTETSVIPMVPHPHRKAKIIAQLLKLR